MTLAGHRAGYFTPPLVVIGVGTTIARVSPYFVGYEVNEKNEPSPAVDRDNGTHFSSRSFIS